jgi:hypothetical protein
MIVDYRKSVAACLLLGLFGCSDKDITTYRVPHEPDVIAAAVPTESGGAAAAPRLHWEVPPGWETQAPGGLRAASFRAPGPNGDAADVSVVTFAGAGGDVLANINRWRGQLQLPPITAAQLPAEVKPLDAAGGHFLLADIRGEPAGNGAAVRILGAWLEQPGHVWFFKMMGPDGAVESQKAAFFGFLQSVAPGAGSDGVTGASAPAENTNDLPHAAFVVAPTGAGDEPALRWQAPPEWRSRPISAMRKGSYAIGRDGAEADLSITAFPGEVGGLVANVNRWRGQIGLPPVEEAELGTATETFTANGLTFTLVDFTGPATGGPQRMLAAIVPWQGVTWFFKLLGPAGVVGNEQSVFRSFLQTVRTQ